MSLLSVYNHLISGQIFMRQTRFDTHKRSELKDIYQKIRKMNVDQPFYKVDFDAKAQEFTIGVKGRSMQLMNTMRELNPDENSNIYSDKVVVSDKPDVVSATLMDYAENKEFEELEISVNSIATTQRNEGKYVLSDESELPGGQYNFTVDIENNAYSFQFNVTDGATNGELLGKLADFINKTQVGLRARVGGNRETGVSRMEMVAVAAGTDNDDNVSFRFKDTKTPSGNGRGIVKHFGLDNVVREAKNTEFTINNEPHSIRTKEYVTNDGVRLDFHKTSEEGEPIRVASVVADTPILAKAYEITDQYNKLLDFIQSQAGDKRAPKRLLYELDSIVKRHSDEFNELGFAVNENGRLSINQERMSSGIRSGALSEAFLRSDSVCGRLIKKLSDVSINPMDFVDKTVITYPNTAAKKPFSPYITSVYSGMIYNNYC